MIFFNDQFSENFTDFKYDKFNTSHQARLCRLILPSASSLLEYFFQSQWVH